jgi:hypothetical protein
MKLSTLWQSHKIILPNLAFGKIVTWGKTFGSALELENVLRRDIVINWGKYDILHTQKTFLKD